MGIDWQAPPMTPHDKSIQAQFEASLNAFE
jgi:hypothetical protein